GANGTTTIPTVLTGAGTYQLVLAGAAASNTSLSGNLAGFSGTIQVSGSSFNKLNTTGFTGAGATISVDSGNTLFVPATVAFAGLNLVGAGNGENLGALRVASGATLNAPITLGGATTFSQEGGIIAGAISASTGSALTLAGTGNLSLTGAISGPISIAKNGAGTLTFAGSNTYTGTTNIAAGSVSYLTAASLVSAGTTIANGLTASFNVGGAAEFGTADLANILAVTFTGGASTNTLAFNTQNATAPAAFTGVIANPAGGTFAITKNGAGTLVLAGLNTYTGVTTVNGGILEANTIADTVGSSLGLGTATGISLATGGTLRFTGATGTSTRPLNVTTGSIDVSSATGVLTLNPASGNITAGLTKTGAGALVLQGNRFTGTNTATVTVSGGALTMNGTNTFSGGTSVASGASATAASVGAFGTGVVTVAAGGTFTLGAPVAATNTYTLGGLAGAGTVNVTNIGTGTNTVQFTGTPNYSAFTGTLNIGFNGVAGAFTGKFAGSNIGTSAATINVLPNATLFTGGNAATTYLFGGTTLGESLGQLRLVGTNTGNIVLAGPQIAANGSLGGNGTESGVVSGNISESGLVPRTLFLRYGTGGTITLSGTNTFTGGINIGSTGTLVAASAANLGAAPVIKDAGALTLNGGNLTLTNATALSLDPKLAFAVTAAGTLTGAAGSITIGGTSTLSNTLSLNLNAGNLTFSGNVNPFGQFSNPPGGTLVRNAVTNSVANTIAFAGQTNLT
ncbi:MAG: hypothetical protein EBU72_13630, partial [Betaproteobacteria bacterium]|nr:hypothetical protein [Betaproteobacteria bacterium]